MKFSLLLVIHANISLRMAPALNLEIDLLYSYCMKLVDRRVIVVVVLKVDLFNMMILQLIVVCKLMM